MSSATISVGQSRVVAFFAVCCTLALTNIVRGMLARTSNGMFFALAQGVFVLFTGAAAWYLYQSKKAGWYLSLIVVLNWFGSVASLRDIWNILTSVFTVGMIVVLIWLFRPDVKARFEVKF
jgi:hypothetical protein